MLSQLNVCELSIWWKRWNISHFNTEGILLIRLDNWSEILTKTCTIISITAMKKYGSFSSLCQVQLVINIHVNTLYPSVYILSCAWVTWPVIVIIFFSLFIKNLNKIYTFLQHQLSGAEQNLGTTIVYTNFNLLYFCLNNYLKYLAHKSDELNKKIKNYTMKF